MASNSEELPRSIDWNRWTWIGIAVMIALMNLVMWRYAEIEPITSIVRARHILIPFEHGNPDSRTQAFEQAVELRGRIQQGESFGKLAREYSGDEGSALRGGDLGWAERGVYEDNFEHYVYWAPLNEVSRPVQTPFGYHLIEVVDRKFSDYDLREMEIQVEALKRLGEDAQQRTARDGAEADSESAAQSR